LIELHHLNKSRSKRIIWLLEEAAIPYKIIPYQRDAATSLAPKALLNVHPLGKSPVITDKGKVINESGAIVDHIISCYAPHLAPQLDSEEYIHYQSWLHFAESSAALPMLLNYFLKMDGSKTNFLGEYAVKELNSVLAYMNDSLADREFFMGNYLSGADIMNSFIIESIFSTGLMSPFANLERHYQKIKARAAYIKSDELEAHHDTTTTS